MNNRDSVKWAPFNSVINGNILIKELENAHKKIPKPTLSEDQFELISNRLFEAYTTQDKVQIKYYKNGNIFNCAGIIKFLNKIEKYIIINKLKIYCNQIINIEFNFF